jgi:two-component system, NarL family, sensor kinase
MSGKKHTSPDQASLLRHNRELFILNAIAESLNVSIDLEQTLKIALVQAAGLLDLDIGWIWLFHEKTGEAYLAASLNLPPHLAEHRIFFDGSCSCLDTFIEEEREGTASINVLACSRLCTVENLAEGVRYHASIPLKAHEKMLGILNLASQEKIELSADELSMLYTVGDMLSIAVERAILFQQSAEMGAVEERNRLAREIHDTLAQGLAGIAMQLETADELLEYNGERTRIQKIVQNALALARTNLEEARRSVLDLRAAPLEGRSLSEALIDLAASFKNSELEIQCHCKGAERPIPIRIEVGLYRIAQEAMMNAVNHSHASKVDLELTVTPGRLILVLNDNGVGFEPSITPDGRFGLIGLNERANLLGGTLKIESLPGHGTKVEVVVPMIKEEK